MDEFFFSVIAKIVTTVLLYVGVVSFVCVFILALEFKDVPVMFFSELYITLNLKEKIFIPK